MIKWLDDFEAAVQCDRCGVMAGIRLDGGRAVANQAELNKRQRELAYHLRSAGFRPVDEELIGTGRAISGSVVCIIDPPCKRDES